MRVTIAELIHELNLLENPFNLTGGLGETLLDQTAMDIADNCRSQVDAEGMPWASLSAWSTERKDKVAPGMPIGKQSGLMLAAEQLRGERTITAKAASMKYGRDDKARVEATKFQEGGEVTGTNQPKRSFYGISPTQADRADALLETTFDNVLH